MLFLPLCSIVPVSHSYGQHKETSDRPNVILIYSDDQGWADLGVYGSPDIYSPVLDNLAKHGTRFTQFYVAAAVCSPSRASLLTGRYPQRAGLTGNASSQEGHDGMPGNQYTIAELFKDARYKTAHIGKWHVGYSNATMPNAQGFDHSFGFMGGCIDNYSHYFYWDGPNRHDLWRNGKRIYEPGKYFPDLMVKEATEFIRDNKSSPFFMYFAINIPHYPLQGEQKWVDYYEKKGIPSPRSQYAAFVSTMDEKIGNLLQYLEETGLSENTIIVFQADHGYSEEVRTFGGGGDAGVFRGSKFSLFEGGIRVPSIISWPGHIPENAVREQLAANIDWLPTLAEYCAIALPDRKIDGKSLVTVISDPTAKSPHDVFFWNANDQKEDGQWAVRQGKWKLLHRPAQAKKEELDDNGFFLVDMDDDLRERKNVSIHHPNIVSQLTDLFKNWNTEVANTK